MNEYLEKVIELASDVFGVPKEQLNEDATWVDDLHLDVLHSLQDRSFVDYKRRLEDEFEIDIPNIKFGKTRNMKEIAAFIEELCEE